MNYTSDRIVGLIIVLFVEGFQLFHERRISNGRTRLIGLCAVIHSRPFCDNLLLLFSLPSAAPTMRISQNSSRLLFWFFWSLYQSWEFLDIFLLQVQIRHVRVSRS